MERLPEDFTVIPLTASLSIESEIMVSFEVSRAIPPHASVCACKTDLSMRSNPPFFTMMPRSLAN